MSVSNKDTLEYALTDVKMSHFPESIIMVAGGGGKGELYLIRYRI